jgi:beta-xylosidase
MSTNPVIWADVPDPSVIRVGNIYYMTSTTMYFTPGCPIMKSTNLLDWEIIGYVYDILEDNDHMNLQNGKHDYGRGSWASCLRYHNGTFYVSFVAYNTGKTYIFQTENIESGAWRKHTIDGIYHDMSILFDCDDRVFMVYGAGAIKIIELSKDATAIKQGGMNKTIIENADPTGGTGFAEGAHIYKLNGWYYIFIIAWPKTGNRRRVQVCYRSDKIDGNYESKIVLDDDMGFQNAGVAQGGIVDTPSGEWYAMLFQDHGAVGRIPVLVPVTWENDWPVFGENGKLELPLLRQFSQGIVKSDEFDGKKLALVWQWNHNPVDTHWSLKTRTGWLRLTTSHISDSLITARNTLTQRTFGAVCSGYVKIDVSHMKNGDCAGLAALQEKYAFVGIKMEDNAKKIIMATASETEESILLNQDILHLRIDFDFTEAVDIAGFYYSLCGSEWTKIGSKLKMSYRLSHFTGYRFALFNFATKKPGGHVDFDWFRIERDIIPSKHVKPLVPRACQSFPSG